MSDGLDTSPLERMQARFNDVRTRLRAWMDEQQTPWKIPCDRCNKDRFLNLDASVNLTMTKQDFTVNYFACKCRKDKTPEPASKPSTRATAPDP
jgi:hypothetical protein